METRYCDKCEDEHDIDEFYVRPRKYPNKNGDGGYKTYTSYICKSSNKKANAESHLRNKNINVEAKKIKRNANSKCYREKNKEKISDGWKKYYEKSKDKLNVNNRVKAKKRYVENKEEYSERNKKYRENNKEKVKKFNKIYNENNKKELSEKRKIYRESNRDKILQKQRETNKTEEGFLSAVLSRVKTQDKKNNKTFDIDIEYIRSLLVEQKNMCHFCKSTLEIECGDKKLSQASLDRISNELGHSKGNVHWVCFFCNHARNCNSVDNYKLFINLLTNKCDHKNYEYIEHIEHAIKISTLHDNCKSVDRRKFPDVKDTITSREIKEMIKKQDYKCAISGLPLHYSSINRFVLQPSVDRIDNAKAHIKDNCQIVCLAVQLGRLTNSIENTKAHIDKIRQINVQSFESRLLFM